MRFDVFRSYLTPVRDEEAEAQRKARSRHARQSRRSTQVQMSPAQMLTADEEKGLQLWGVLLCVSLVPKVVLSFLHIKGVTLTDLQEAEKTMKTMKMDNKGKEKEEEEKEKEAKSKKAEEGVRAIFQSYSPVCPALCVMWVYIGRENCVYRK